MRTAASCNAGAQAGAESQSEFLSIAYSVPGFTLSI